MFFLLLLFCFVFPLGPAAQRDELLLFLYGCALFFEIISFNLIYSFFCIKSTIKMVVVVSLLWNLGFSEGLCDFCPQSFAS